MELGTDRTTSSVLTQDCHLYNGLDVVWLDLKKIFGIYHLNVLDITLITARFCKCLPSPLFMIQQYILNAS
jgi:hypothetical protein